MTPFSASRTRRRMTTTTMRPRFLLLPFFLSTVVLSLLLLASPVSSKCQVSWSVGCGQKSATSNVTLTVTDEIAGAGVLEEYDARIVFHWGPEDADLGERTYSEGESVSTVRSYKYDAEGGYYTGYSVTFGEGSGAGCEGETFGKYALVMFEDDSRTCMFGPTLESIPRFTDRPTNFPITSAPVTPRPTTASPSRRPTPLPSERPSARPTRRPSAPPTAPWVGCGDSTCSIVEDDESCPADCAAVVLRADPPRNSNERIAQGAMFSVRSYSDRHVVVRSIDILAVDGGVERVQVYTKLGGYEGHESDDGAWRRVYNNYQDLGSGGGGSEPTTLVLNNEEGVWVPRGRVASFFVYTDSRLRCGEGTGAGDVLASDGALRIYQGIGLGKIWTLDEEGDDGGPLAFRGAFTYDVVKAPPTVAPTVATTASPTAELTVEATPTIVDVGSERTESPVTSDTRPMTPTVVDVGSMRTVSPVTSDTRPTSTSLPLTPAPVLDVRVTEPPAGGTPVAGIPVVATPAEGIPLTKMQEHPVSCEMVLSHSELMDEGTQKIWTDVTTETIRDHAVKRTGIIPESVAVEVELENQATLEQVRRLMARHQESARDLQQSSTEEDARIRIEFTATLRVPSEGDELEAGGIIASAFGSPARRNGYVSALRESEAGSHFERLEGVSVQVDGDSLSKEVPAVTSKRPQEETSGETTTTAPAIEIPMHPAGGDKMYYIIASAVGALFILTIVAAMAMYYVKRRNGGESAKMQSTPTGLVTDDHLLDRVGLDIDAKSAAHTQTPTSYIGTIESKEEVDDVSTLGDPYMGDAVNAVMDTDNTVGESMVSSKHDMHVFGVGRPNGMDASQVGGSTIHSGSYVRNNMMFGEDTTLEDIYRSPLGTSMGEENQTSAFHKVTVMAPCGKLGIVLDNPHGDLPVVWAIKETSALNGKIRVGDLLLSVDGVDCRGMSTHRVSTFLSSRSQNPTRTMVLARGSETGNEMVGV